MNPTCVIACRRDHDWTRRRTVVHRCSWQDRADYDYGRGHQRLYGTNLTCCVLDDEIPVIELGMKLILDQFVISMILALVREGAPPARTALQIAARDDFELPRRSHRLVSQDVDNLACRMRCPCFRHDLTLATVRAHKAAFYHDTSTPKLTYPSQTNSLVICDLTSERTFLTVLECVDANDPCAPLRIAFDVAGAPAIYRERWPVSGEWSLGSGDRSHGTCI